MMWKKKDTNTATLWLLLLLAASVVFADHPGPQPRPAPSTQYLSDDGSTTFVVTPRGQFPAQDPFAEPPGSNHLENVYSNMFDFLGNEMPNTLPSRPNNPYNLHPDPVVTEIDKTSPTDDLAAVFKRMRADFEESQEVDLEAVQQVIDILEGNPIPDRVYSGFPLLHYNGPEKPKMVEPIFDHQGNVVGGNVNVHRFGTTATSSPIPAAWIRQRCGTCRGRSPIPSTP